MNLPETKWKPLSLPGIPSTSDPAVSIQAAFGRGYGFYDVVEGWRRPEDHTLHSLIVGMKEGQHLLRRNQGE